MCKSCERCGREFSARVYSQRFCGKVCSDAFYQEERRTAVQMLRETSTYHGRAAEEVQVGGRWQTEAHRVDWHGQPEATWSEDLSGLEPSISGDGLEWGRPIDDA
jgi:hypothetical protein